MEKGYSGALNLGSDNPFTVRQVVEAAGRTTGKEIAYEIGPRRPGDPPALLASSAKAEEILGWLKRCSTLEEIISSAYQWKLSHPNGYSR